MAQRLVFKVFSYIDETVADLFINKCNEYSKHGLDIDILVTSIGGTIWNTNTICKVLQTYKEKNPTAKIRTYVYTKALSAAMYFVLIADEFYCCDFTQFGPIDPQFWSDDHVFVVNKHNFDEISKIKTNSGMLETAVCKYKTGIDNHIKIFKDFLINHPKYSENKDSIYELLYCPISHLISFTLNTIENVGIKRTGEIPSDFLTYFTSDKYKDLNLTCFLHTLSTTKHTISTNNITSDNTTSTLHITNTIIKSDNKTKTYSLILSSVALISCISLLAFSFKK